MENSIDISSQGSNKKATGVNQATDSRDKKAIKKRINSTIKMKTKKKETYEAPALIKVEKMIFMFEPYKKITKVACRQCSGCHGCR